MVSGRLGLFTNRGHDFLCTFLFFFHTIRFVFFGSSCFHVERLALPYGSRGCVRALACKARAHFF